MAKKIHAKQLGNKFILREGYLKEEYFEDAIKERINTFERNFPRCKIDVRRNKHGARVIAYERN